MIDLFGKTRQILANADKARDNRQWVEAAANYREYLAARPNDAAIWVQLGHALKESGNLAAAEDAYLRSHDLAPQVADTKLQLGHLYKTMHRTTDAVRAYREATRLDGTLEDACRELAAFGLSDDTAPEPITHVTSAAATFIDLSDVFFYLRHHKTLSGIQRVQIGIANALISLPGTEHSDIAFLAEADDEGGYVIIDDVFISELAKELARETVTHGRLLEIMNASVRRGRIYKPTAGDTLLILGAFWVLQNIAERIISLRRQGVRVGTLIHDIIPITHPEFCEKSLTDSFKAFIFSVLSVADFIFTVSDYSGRQVSNFLAESRISHAPIRTLRLAHKTWDTSVRPSGLCHAVSKVIKENYVLYVSTIEVRKNHTYLFRIWRRLVERLGSDAPTLVFVGRPGWRVNDLVEQMQSTSNLNGKIRILHDLTDMELAALYSAAAFTVFPSFEEGWGLPVGESLIFGRPCIASNTSSIPEVGGDFVDYVDPFNINDGFEKMLRYVMDRSLLEQRASEIRKGFKPREWADVARDMITLVETAVGNPEYRSQAITAPQAVPGRLYYLGHRDNVSEFISSGDSAFVHLLCDTAWGPVENFGRWARTPNATLQFRTERSSNEPVSVMLEINTVGWLGRNRLRMIVNSVEYDPIDLEPGARQYVLLNVAPIDENVVMEFATTDPIVEGSDPRKYLWMGVASVAYAPVSDVIARLSLVEHVLYGASAVKKTRPSLH